MLGVVAPVWSDGQMSDPTAMPFQEDDHSTSPEDSIYEGERPSHDPGPTHGGAPGRGDAPSQGRDTTDTDRLAAQVTGPEDQVGMTALWRLTMDLEHWWFIAVGDEDSGLESPAAAVIECQLMLMTFTTAERARQFAVDNRMIQPEDDLRAIALPPLEVVESAQTYHDAGIGGLMFDPHIAGYFIPTEQLPVVWDAVHSTATGQPVMDDDGA